MALGRLAGGRPVGRRKRMMLVGPPACRTEQRATLKPTTLGPPLQSKYKGRGLHARCPCGERGRASAIRFLLSRAACVGGGGGERGRKAADRWTEEVRSRGSVWEQRTSGAGGGEEGRLRFSFVDQKEQRRKAAAERGVCTPQIGAGCLWEEGAPSLSMALKLNPSSFHFLVRHVRLQTHRFLELMFVLNGHD